MTIDLRSSADHCGALAVAEAEGRRSDTRKVCRRSMLPRFSVHLSDVTARSRRFFAGMPRDFCFGVIFVIRA